LLLRGKITGAKIRAGFFSKMNRTTTRRKPPTQKSRTPPSFAQLSLLVRDVIATGKDGSATDLKEAIKLRCLAVFGAYRNEDIHLALAAIEHLVGTPMPEPIERPSRPPGVPWPEGRRTPGGQWSRLGDLAAQLFPEGVGRKGAAP
jgi:hypothetical protein